MSERRAALNLTASLLLPAQPLNPETLHFATFQEEPVKIRAKSVANLHFEQPSSASEPKYSLGSSGACFRGTWTWWVKQEYLCPRSRELGMGLCALVRLSVGPAFPLQRRDDPDKRAVPVPPSHTSSLRFPAAGGGKPLVQGSHWAASSSPRPLLHQPRGHLHQNPSCCCRATEQQHEHPSG